MQLSNKTSFDSQVLGYSRFYIEIPLEKERSRFFITSIPLESRASLVTSVINGLTRPENAGRLNLAVSHMIGNLTLIDCFLVQSMLRHPQAS